MHERILNRKIDLLAERMIVSSERIIGWKYRLAEYMNPGELEYSTDWLDYEHGTRFKPLVTILFRLDYTLPKDKNYFHFAIENGEALLHIDDHVYAGIDPNHSLIPIREDLKGITVELRLEMMSLLVALRDPKRYAEATSQISFKIVAMDEAIRAFYFDVKLLREVSQIETNERRKKLMEKLLEDTMLAVDLTNSDAAFLTELKTAAQMLRQRIAAIGQDAESGKLQLVGHAHIDVSWLWRYRETIRKAARTFSTAIRLLEKYPDFTFLCSQPHLYLFIKENFPNLYEEIKKWAATGRWEVCGAMWVECDCNVPSGESLIRQALYGVQFFLKEFGIKTRTCWLPDVFGYPATLPTILKHAEIDFFFTCKLHWQARDKFPLHLFKWKGIDGTDVLAHIPLLQDFYGGWPNPQELSVGWKNFAQKDVHDEVLFPFGHGDGGGGVTLDMLEYAERVKDYPGLPKTSMNRVQTYLEQIEKNAPELPVWDDELYLQTHRGTYTTQAKVKKYNRKLEILLRNFELLSVIARPFGMQVAAREFEALWRVLLLHQFHDDLPGSSIHQVYEDTLNELGTAIQKAQEGIDHALDKLVEKIAAPENSVLLFNPLSFPHKGVVEMDDADPVEVRSLRDDDGNFIPFQITEKNSFLFVSNEVAPFATSVYRTSRAPSANKPSSLKYSGLTFENRFFKLELNADGTIRSLVDKRNNREIIHESEAANVMELFQDGPDTEAAWNVHDTFDRRQYPLNDDTTIEVVETGPVRLVVRVRRTFRSSKMKQDIILYDQLDRIDFKTWFNWQERQVLLKVAFPVQVLSKKATYEIQFGAIERSTHRNFPIDQAQFEVCGHRWIDLSEADYGVSLLNDCKYGFDVKRNKLRITLLRGSDMPDPTADIGEHEMVYSLYPHHGRWTDALTVRKALELNNPLLSRVKRNETGTIQKITSLFSVSKPSVILDTVKPAEDGRGIIVRLYEAHGSRGQVPITTHSTIKSVEACTALENKIESDIKAHNNSFEFQIKPFELRSFRIVLE